MIKNILKGLGLLLLLSSLVSCSTTLKMNKTINSEQLNYGKELMEFIGFKNSKNINNVDWLLGSFGGTLSNAHIAVDKSKYYLGIYSFNELMKYKSEMRYISFVEIDNHTYSYNDNYGIKPGLYAVGVVLSCTIALLPIGIPLMIAGSGNKCMIKLNGEYTIYVYDTQKQEIILTTPLKVNVSDVYKGQYLGRKSESSKVDEYYRIYLSNELLGKYKDAYMFIENLNSGDYESPIKQKPK